MTLHFNPLKEEERMKRFSLLAAVVAVLFVGCSTVRPERVELGDGGQFVEGVQVAKADSVNKFLTSGTHHTVTQIDDVTDPAHPVTLRKWEGNLLGECGVRNLMAMAFAVPGITLTPASLGTASGGGETLGTYCVGAVGSCSARLNSTLNTSPGGQIVIGAGSTSTCTASATPWACCTGNGAGCAVSNLDIMTFAEGQPNGSLTNAQTNYTSWVSGGKPNVTALTIGTASLYWNGASLEGIQMIATATSSIANQQWCEYAVRNAAGAGGATDCNYTVFSGSSYVGYQLNHAVINPCLTKSSGQTFQITVTITLS